MAVDAPYRFAPVHRWIYEPAWSEFVSHDVPFMDGLSGSVTVEIEATTPVLVGGPRRKATEGEAGEVWPFKLASGDYALPPSALQGMVRSLLEIVGFGRLGDWIDERRVGYRDLGDSETAQVYYKSRMTSKSGRVITQHAKAGWLLRDGDRIRLVPCQFARIDFSEIKMLAGGASSDPANVLGSRNDARRRYQWFLGATGLGRAALDKPVYLDPPQAYRHANNSIDITYSRAFTAAQPGRRAIDSTLIFTGKPQNGVGARQKKLEFVFHAPNRVGAAAAPAASALDVPKDVWRDFNDIHGAKPGRAENPAWSFWKDALLDEQPVPAFYLEEGGEITTITMAFMGKTALDLSTHDDLRNSTPAHVRERKGRPLDLPCTIFGDVAADDPAAGLKRRASFDLAIAKLPPNGRVEPSNPTVLLGPKPSYFPSYIRQPSYAPPGQLPNGVPHAVSASSAGAGAQLKPEHLHPELAGVKLWPANDTCTFPDLPPAPQLGQGPNCSTHIVLNALPKGTTFTTTLRFHNLRPIELGAVLWALSFAEAAAMRGKISEVKFRHRIGMGKPYGLGSVRIALTNLAARFNDPARKGEAATVDGMVEAFVAHMSAVYGAARKDIDQAPGKKWLESVQVKAVLKAADPSMNGNVPRTYMGLGHRTEANTYVGERALGHFLPAYVAGDEFNRPKSGGLGAEASGRGPPPEPQMRWVKGARVRDREGNEGRIDQSPGPTGVVMVRFDYGEREWVAREELTFISPDAGAASAAASAIRTAELKGRQQ